MEVRELEGVPDVEDRFGTGAVCPVHGAPALETCERCGAFVCPECAGPGEAGLRCEACAARPPDGASEPLPGSPWRRMWFHPRRSLRHLLMGPRPLRAAAGVAALTGAAWGAFLYVLVLQGAPPQTRITDLLGPLVVLVGGGGIAQAVLTAFAAWVVRVAGGILGGRAAFADVAAALAWAWLPVLALAGVLIILIVGWPGAPNADPVPPFVPATVALTPLAALWNLVLAVLGVAEAHRFGAGRALVALGGPLVLPVAIAVLSLALVPGLGRPVP